MMYYPEGDICRHCGQQIGIRNPTGKCDHLYYPAYCDVCKENVQKTKTMRFEDELSSFGLDLDTKNKKAVEWMYDRIHKLPGILEIRKYSSSKGYHFKVDLVEPVTIARTFEMRYFCGDDYHRLVKDMLRAMNGQKVIDVLFDLKQIHHDRERKKK